MVLMTWMQVISLNHLQTINLYEISYTVQSKDLNQPQTVTRERRYRTIRLTKDLENQFIGRRDCTVINFYKSNHEERAWWIGTQTRVKDRQPVSWEKQAQLTEIQIRSRKGRLG